MKVVGVQEKSGEYQGINYHNVLIHCLKLDDNAYGEVTEVIKIKFINVKEVFGKAMSAANWQELIGKDIKACYNKYGVADDVHVIDSK